MPDAVAAAARNLNLRLLTFDDVCTLFGEPNLKPHVPPKPEDLSTAALFRLQPRTHPTSPRTPMSSLFSF